MIGEFRVFIQTVEIVVRYYYILFKGILSLIYKLYLKERYFCPDHNYTLENLKNFFILEKKVKKIIIFVIYSTLKYVIGFKLQHPYGVIGFKL